MAEQPPKKEIKRVTVPKVTKEIPSSVEIESSVISPGTNLLLLLLLLLVGGLTYMAIFNKKELYSFFSISSYTTTTKTPVSSDTVTVQDLTESDDNQINTIIGEDNFSPEPSKVETSGSAFVYPPGSTFYLVAGTFVFQPYAVQYNEKMKNEGYSTKILTSAGTDRNYYRIYLEKSDDIAAIRKKRDNLRTTKGLNVWIYAER